MNAINFYDLSPHRTKNNSSVRDEIFEYWHILFNDQDIKNDIAQLTQSFDEQDWQNYQLTWQNIDQNNDQEMTDWLMALFNQLFNQPDTHIMPTILVRGGTEPEYFPANGDKPARIEFAHGFFASCLHEISHWCIAGKHRRTLNDFGYWYESDGRDANKQAIFEQVEIKPQAIECLLNQACGRFFYVSQDNLNADFDTSKSTFDSDVYHQAIKYLSNPHTLPKDARRLIWVFLYICQNFQIKHQG